MGLFDWLKRVLGGPPQVPPPMADERRWQAPQPAQPAPRPAAQATPAAPAPKSAAKPQRKSTTLNLDAAQFAPLSHADVKKQATAAGSQLLWSPWFGRRDKIPPSTDARTNLIDRAMVGQGLITPEELAEIHDVGLKMEELRPDIHMAHALAEQAVKRTLEERQRIKERKKAEAAERKRKHDEAVTHRKRTDIIFLGRGVSAGLADRRANVEKLQAAGLPVLATPSDVAQALELTIPRLRWLAFHSEAAMRTHYVRFTVPKRSGGTRELCTPHRELARVQEWILVNILEKVTPHDAAHGFVPGRSTVSNATPHVARKVIVNVDLKDFFPTVTVRRVIGIFRQMGYSPAAATVLGLLCTEPPRRVVTYAGETFHVAVGPRALPQGACTSPALSNLVARGMDARLRGVAGKLGWQYTRYADDMSFSAEGEAAEKVGYLLARARHIAEDEGFAINESKTRVQRQHHAMKVTGVVVNQRPGVDRKLVRRLRAILHQAKETGLAAQNRENRPHFEAWLRGMIAYVQMVNAEQGRKLREAFEAL